MFGKKNVLVCIPLLLYVSTAAGIIESQLSVSSDFGGPRHKRPGGPEPAKY